MLWAALAAVAVFVPLRLAAIEDTAAGTGREGSDLARLAARALLLDVAAVGERVIAVGERGHVLVSEDSGGNWIQARVPTRSMLTAVSMVGRDHIWVVGHDAVILYSADGGQTWTRQFFAPQEEAPLLDVWFENTNHGLAVGAYGIVLETGNGGRSWERRSIVKGDPHFYAITEGLDGTLHVAGESGSVLRSRDRGKSWFPLTSPYEGSFFGALALSDGALLVFGLRGNLYRSEDGGLNWRHVQTGTKASLMSGVELADGTIVLVGLSGTVLVSRDRGKSFTAANRTDRQGIAAVAELESARLLIIGEAGVSRIQTPPADHSEAKSAS